MVSVLKNVFHLAQMIKNSAAIMSSILFKSFWGICPAFEARIQPPSFVSHNFVALLVGTPLLT